MLFTNVLEMATSLVAPKNPTEASAMPLRPAGLGTAGAPPKMLDWYCMSLMPVSPFGYMGLARPKYSGSSMPSTWLGPIVDSSKSSNSKYASPAAAAAASHPPWSVYQVRSAVATLATKNTNKTPNPNCFIPISSCTV